MKLSQNGGTESYRYFTCPNKVLLSMHSFYTKSFNKFIYTTLFYIYHEIVNLNKLICTQTAPMRTTTRQHSTVTNKKTINTQTHTHTELNTTCYKFVKKTFSLYPFKQCNFSFKVRSTLFFLC